MSVVRSTPLAEREALLTSNPGWNGFTATLWRMTAGHSYLAPSPVHRLGIHFSAPINANCRCDGLRQRRHQMRGDIDVIPVGLDGEWVDEAECIVLGIAMTQGLIDQATEGLELDPRSIRLTPRLQARNPGIEHIGWALKAELESPFPVGRLYADSLGLALAINLVRDARPVAQPLGRVLTLHRKRRLLDFIEEHLDRELTLQELADIAGISTSHLKTLFSATMGQPVHRYVIHRRVERATRLLLAGEPIAQAALAAGFAHQSHLAHWMRRLSGITPRDVVRTRQ